MAESACLSGDGKSGKMSHEHALVAPFSRSPRRRLLQILADGQGRTATVLVGNVGKRLDANAIPATKTGYRWEMDFGYCLVRGCLVALRLNCRFGCLLKSVQ
jgi:hypothetical protein